MKPEAETCLQESFDEVKIPEGEIVWRANKKLVEIYCWPAVVRISRTQIKGKYYKSVYAAKKIPADAVVGLYLGKVVDSVSDGRWRVRIPGYRKVKSLNSKITKNLP